ncbi:MAG TPA: hypothetical protein VJT33_11165 [bacterium]|nr:hypothetical protein [bacterium]
MRYLVVACVLAALVGTTATVLAEPNGDLPVSGAVALNGAINGTTTIGGVTGTMTSSGGGWTFTVGGATFAGGTYACSGGSCSYTGTVSGSTRILNFTTNGPAGTVSLATGFRTHGAWVSTVAHFGAATRSALTRLGTNAGRFVSGAARDPAGGHSRSLGGSHDSGGLRAAGLGAGAVGNGRAVAAGLDLSSGRGDGGRGDKR